MRVLFLSCALCAAACGGSDNPPAQNPSSTSATVTGAPAPADTNTTWSPPPSSGPSALMPQTPAIGATSAAYTPQGDSTFGSDAGALDQNADNTKRNERDRHGSLTPVSQGNSADETKLTAAVRKSVMSDKSLSFTAKNVKIITVGTKVTLRGPVNTDDERSAIERYAKQTTGVTEVDDQIEVKK